jgi:hypothetical protein
MIHDVVNARSVVIDSFDIAPNVSDQVPNGRIVAAGLLDVLTRIQASTRSSAEHRNLSNAWTSDIALEVPETGISIGELERMLKARLGHDQHSADTESHSGIGTMATAGGAANLSVAQIQVHNERSGATQEVRSLGSTRIASGMYRPTPGSP